MKVRLIGKAADCKSVRFISTGGSSPPRHNAIQGYKRHDPPIGNSSSMVEHSVVVGDTSVRFCGFALLYNTYIPPPISNGLRYTQLGIGIHLCKEGLRSTITCP